MNAYCILLFLAACAVFILASARIVLWLIFGEGRRVDGIACDAVADADARNQSRQEEQ